MALVTCHLGLRLADSPASLSDAMAHDAVWISSRIAAELDLPLRRFALSRARGLGVTPARAVSEAELAEVARDAAARGRSLFLYFRSAKDLTMTVVARGGGRLQLAPALFKSSSFVRRFEQFIAGCCDAAVTVDAACSLGEPNPFNRNVIHVSDPRLQPLVNGVLGWLLVLRPDRAKQFRRERLDALPCERVRWVKQHAIITFTSSPLQRPTAAVASRIEAALSAAMMNR